MENSSNTQTLIMQLVTSSTEKIVTDNYIKNHQADISSHYEFMAGELATEYKKCFDELNELRQQRNDLKHYILLHQIQYSKIYKDDVTENINYKQLQQIEQEIFIKQIELSTLGKVYKMAILKAEQ